jgi:hypothetical protein
LQPHSVHFAYGNIEYALEHWRGAKRSYGDALKIALTETPIHFITAAIYYCLGCVEFAMGDNEVALLVLLPPTLIVSHPSFNLRSQMQTQFYLQY